MISRLPLRTARGPRSPPPRKPLSRRVVARAVGRKKVDIRPIPEGRKRQVTFMKRKTGLLKKAMELSILCQCDMAVVIFNHNGKLYDYGSTDIHKTIRRFRNGGKGESEAYNSNEVRRAAPLTVARLLPSDRRGCAAQYKTAAKPPPMVDIDTGSDDNGAEIAAEPVRSGTPKESPYRASSSIMASHQPG